MRSRIGLALVGAVASLTGACTTVLYKGPQRPASQIAALVSKDTMIDSVDNLKVREKGQGNYSRYEVLPGEHQVGITLNLVTPGLFYTNVQRSGVIVVCVELEAGHTYRTQAKLNGARWVPQVVDEKTNRAIDPYCDGDDDDETAVDTKKPAAAAPPALALETSPVATAPDGGAAAPEGGAPEPDGGEPVPAAAPADTVNQAQALDAEPAAPPAAGIRARPARLPQKPMPHQDHEQPAADAEESGRKPGSGLSLFTGFGFGGEDFVRASSSNGNEETLSAGTGFIVGLGAMVTPLWITEGVGLGLGVDGAVKYDSIDAANGSASITRFPLAFTAHLLATEAGSPHYFFLKGGAIRDFSVNYSVSGFASIDANVEGTWGPTGGIGYYKKSNDVFAWDLMGFFAITDHVVGTEKFSANTFGLTMGAHLNF